MVQLVSQQPHTWSSPFTAVQLLQHKQTLNIEWRPLNVRPALPTPVCFFNIWAGLVRISGTGSGSSLQMTSDVDLGRKTQINRCLIWIKCKWSKLYKKSPYIYIYIYIYIHCKVLFRFSLRSYKSEIPEQHYYISINIPVRLTPWELLINNKITMVRKQKIKKASDYIYVDTFAPAL